MTTAASSMIKIMDVQSPESTETPQDISVSDLLNQQTETAAPSSETTTESTNETVQGQGEVQPEVAAPTLKDRVAELGFADVADDNDAQARLIEAYSQQQSRQQELQQQMELLRYQIQLAQQGAQPVQQAQPAQQTQPGWFSPPATNAQLRQQFIAGTADDGSVQWKPNTPPQLIQEYEAEQAYYSDWANKLVRDPVNALAGFKAEILAEAQKQAQQLAEQQAKQQQAQSFVDQQLRDNQDVFYQIDPVTKQIRRDFQGQPLLTEAGVRFDSLLAELEAAGVSDETARWKYAMQSYKAQYGDLKQQATDKIAQARAGHAAKTAAATHIAQRNGQEVNGVANGRRQQQEGLGGRMFSNPEFATSLRW